MKNLELSKNAPIGVFDSGIGGISVLKSLVEIMPNEDFVFVGDSANAPYGTKPVEEVLRLSEESLKKLLKIGAKQIVIACNTATAVSASYLREKYPCIDIVGIEPAIRPAVIENEGKNIALLATDLTVHHKRITALYNAYSEMANVSLVSCVGLVEIIEAGHLYDHVLFEYLDNLLKDYMNYDAFVLGCTHYPLIKDAFYHILGDKVKLYDGGKGTAKRSKDLLLKKDLINEKKESGKVTVINTSNDKRLIDLSYSLLK